LADPAEEEAVAVLEAARVVEQCLLPAIRPFFLTGQFTRTVEMALVRELQTVPLAQVEVRVAPSGC